MLAGFPVVDVKVNLVFGSYHEVDSSEQAFYVAGSMAIKDAMNKATPALLEPYMDVEVVTPDDYLGDVMGDLNGRRGRVQSMEARAGAQVVRAQVPLSEMFGYATDLRSRTQGRALHHAVRPLREGACRHRRRSLQEDEQLVKRRLRRPGGMTPPGPPRRGLDTKSPERFPFGAFCIKTAWQTGTRGLPSLG
ncbi:MAG: hypothetical protein V8Q84_03655 [Bilophila sp.]